MPKNRGGGKGLAMGVEQIAPERPWRQLGQLEGEPKLSMGLG
ncbi:hypothetical protein [Synechococcus sp. RedBA-s]|nr:hypothetical protein [Synechococcus sp. RedBA-s]